jgi:glycosyltransferase involved in cell wall biosynthesis
MPTTCEPDGRVGNIPVVTCIMPTANRRRFVPHALECFGRQDYPHLELVILDDGGDEVADLMPADPRVRYVRLACRQQIGVKRNTACELALGDVIVHWDDDDWSAPHRVSAQVEALAANGADVCGLSRLYFYEPATDRAWEYRYPIDGRPWVYGATLCYTKAFWRRNPFPEIRVGEDTRFVWSNRPARIRVLDDCGLFVATIHSANTSPKYVGDSRWRSSGVAELCAVAGQRWAAYRAAVTGAR